MRPQLLDLRAIVARTVEDARLAGERKDVTVCYQPPDAPVESPETYYLPLPEAVSDPS